MWGDVELGVCVCVAGRADSQGPNLKLDRFAGTDSICQLFKGKIRTYSRDLLG